MLLRERHRSHRDLSLLGAEQRVRADDQHSVVTRDRLLEVLPCVGRRPHLIAEEGKCRLSPLVDRDERVRRLHPGQKIEAARIHARGIDPLVEPPAPLVVADSADQLDPVREARRRHRDVREGPTLARHEEVRLDER